jgi:hypothetical protein
VKTRIQLTPELTVALFCAAGWLLVWVFAFRPVFPSPVAAAAPHAELTRLIASTKTLDKLKAPTLFALPSETGFSGKFIEGKIERHIMPEKQVPAEQYLPMVLPAVPALNPDRLTEKTVPLDEALPVPGIALKHATPAATGTRLFFSPQLKDRAGPLSTDPFPKADSLDSVRVSLTVRADGTVASAFFDSPVTNAALLNAVRRLPFKPAAEQIDGWVEIRFAQKGAE